MHLCVWQKIHSFHQQFSRDVQISNTLNSKSFLFILFPLMPTLLEDLLSSFSIPFSFSITLNNKQSSPQNLPKNPIFLFPSNYTSFNMKWEVEMEEIEAVLEKIWDIHDKLSDAIHSISRTHFLNSTKSFKHNNNSPNQSKFKNNKGHSYDQDFNGNGFVYFKDSDKDSAIIEARSLNSIRAALENLEEHLGFFHTLQTQQRAERDAALARLEQSRIILALRLAEHHGKRYKVIDEAMDFVGNVRDATNCFMKPENSSNPPASAPAEHSSNIFVRVLFSGLNTTKRTLQLNKLGGVLGNAALFALSMLAMLHLQQSTYKDNGMLNIGLKQDRRLKKLSLYDASSSGQSSSLDVRLARG